MSTSTKQENAEKQRRRKANKKTAACTHVSHETEFVYLRLENIGIMRESRTRYNSEAVAPLLFKLRGAVVARRKMGITRVYTGDRHLRIFRREYEKFIDTHVTMPIFMRSLSSPFLYSASIKGRDAFLSQQNPHFYTALIVT